MANYNTKNKPPKPADVYPGLVNKLARAGRLVTELQREIGFSAVADELEISTQAMQQRGDRLKKKEEAK